MDFVKIKLDQFIKEEIKKGNIKINNQKEEEELILMARIFMTLGNKAFDLSNESLSEITRNSIEWIEQEIKGVEVVDKELSGLRQKVKKITKKYLTPELWTEFLYAYQPIKEYLKRNEVIRNREKLKSLSGHITDLFKKGEIRSGDISFFKEIFSQLQDNDNSTLYTNFNKEIFLIPSVETWNINPKYLGLAKKNYDILASALVLEKTGSDKNLEQRIEHEVFSKK